MPGDEKREVSIRDSNGQRVSTAPYPFTEFVVKIYERCNLACDYCYMYEMADQTWKGRPVKMSAETFETLSTRIVEHARSHRLSRLKLVFHGGEPLLRGRDFIGWATSLLRSELDSIDLDVRVQTNGTHLDASMLMMLRDHDIQVGVSLDGGRESNDRHRVGSKGTSSFDLTMDGLGRLMQPAHRHLFRGVYATIDTRNDPVETYEFLLALAPPMLDFLLPHGNWETPPPRHEGDSATPYSDWLIPIFDRWYAMPVQSTSIRLFHSIIVGLLGGQSEVETVGLAPVRTAFVDTDGSINQVDALKSAFSGATETGLTIFLDSFDAAMHHPDVLSRQRGVDALSRKCRDCEIVTVCGGGYYPHRYHSETNFDNPSVYCADLMALIGHIRHRVQRDVVPNPAAMHCSTPDRQTQQLFQQDIGGNHANGSRLSRRIC